MTPSQSSVAERSRAKNERGAGETEDFAALDAFWRAANYLSAAQIFLRANTLLGQPLLHEHIKPRLLGHWGTCPGLNFIYAHLNRAIRKTNVEMLFIAGPGHGGAAPNACAFLEGAYRRAYGTYPTKRAGIDKLVTDFSWPGGASSHVSPYTPGSLHEGGELGYSLAHAYGAVFDNPDLIACCVVGDGEAETGALATSWHSNKFLNPVRDGAVLPILHLNEYKIASPTIFAGLSRGELHALFDGYGYEPIFIEGNDPVEMHGKMAFAVDVAIASIFSLQSNARRDGSRSRPKWPMIILRTPKGWTGPAERHGEPIEGSYRAHQVPLPKAASDPDDLHMLDTWLRSYRPQELFQADGEISELVTSSLPHASRRMSMSPHANGGGLLRDLTLPNWRDFAFFAPSPGEAKANPADSLGAYLSDVVSNNDDRFRIFSPDEAESNRLGKVLEVTSRTWIGPSGPGDHKLGSMGRVLEALSEHLCQGWLEGYLLTGRHGLFASYEAFIHIVDSMLNQFAKWIKVSKETGWRQPIASLNYLLASHVWQQDHNGFTHQDPGFIDHVANKKADLARIYLPPDANTLLCVAYHCLRSRNYVNVIVAGKKNAPCWFDKDEAEAICAAGADTLAWAGSAGSGKPDIVIACAGDVPTLEAIAASTQLKRLAPSLKFRVVCVVDLFCLQSRAYHPHGMSDEDFVRLFTEDRPVLFLFHGYPSLIHRLAYNRPNHESFHVRGYNEEGGTTTPFDMRVVNRLDRFNVIKDVAEYVPDLAEADALRQHAETMLSRHSEYIRREGKDMPEVEDWRWVPK